MWCVPSVLVYARRGDEVLLLKRNQEPNAGLWVAPGGKVALGESPDETARREMAAGTGLEVAALQLRGLCTLVPAAPQWSWYVFVFVTDRFRGTLRPDGADGELAWVSVERYRTDLPVPPADAIFAPQVLGRTGGCYQVKFVFDAEKRLVEWVAY